VNEDLAGGGNGVRCDKPFSFFLYSFLSFFKPLFSIIVANEILLVGGRTTGPRDHRTA